MGHRVSCFCPRSPSGPKAPITYLWVLGGDEAGGLLRAYIGADVLMLQLPPLC